MSSATALDQTDAEILSSFARRDSRWRLSPHVPRRGLIGLDYFYLFFAELLVGFTAACQFKRVGDGCLSFFHAGDDIRAANPVGFGEISLRPLRRMVGMGVIEADDILAAFAAFTLDADQFARIDVIAVLR